MRPGAGLAALLLLLASAAGSPPPPPPRRRPAPLQRPSMGWLAWQQFRCITNCSATDVTCVNERLFRDHAALLASDGWLALGYDRVHIDDCAVAAARDAVTHELPLDATRFPSGLAALAAAVRGHGVRLGVYGAESTHTCMRYPGSAGYEALDASVWAAAGVDHVKQDGCGSHAYFPVGYPLLGAALDAAPSPIVFSCSWPAYEGEDEAAKNWSGFAAAGCVTGRNTDDVQCAWDGKPPTNGIPLLPILDHYGDYSATLQAVTAATGFAMDGDTLLAGTTNQATGAPCLTPDEERTQMAIYCIMALPLLMGNDLRSLRNESRATLQNPRAIAVSQDGGIVGGRRVSPKGAQEAWARNLSGGDVALLLWNKATVPPPACPAGEWVATQGWFWAAGTPCDAPNGNIGCFHNASLDEARATCCADALCAGFSWSPANGVGCFKNAQTCRDTLPGFDGWFKTAWPPAPPPPPAAANVSVSFASLNLPPVVDIVDVWNGESLGRFTGSYTAPSVAPHAAAFLRLTPHWAAGELRGS